MSLDLMSIENSMQEMTSSLATMTPDKIAKISKKMVEMDRANQTAGRKNTQTTNQLMTLNMISAGPYRRMRQCLAQIERKRNALEEAYFKYRKDNERLNILRENGDALSLIEIEEIEHGRERGKAYIEGALKEIAVFQDAYEDIRIANNIPVLWDERDSERDEIRHHIRQVFRQSHRDMCLTGHITQGNAEYLEQYGIHLRVAERLVGRYISEVDSLLDEGKGPSIAHLYSFLDHMVALFEDSHLDVMEEIGLKTIIRDDYLYTE